jgi:hypothetical protein
MLKRAWRWIKNPDNRGALQLIGGCAGGLWVFLQFIYPLLWPTPHEYRVCRGEYESGCTAHDKFIGCDTLESWSRTCPGYKFLGRDSDLPGQKCGYALYRVTCTKKF